MEFIVEQIQKELLILLSYFFKILFGVKEKQNLIKKFEHQFSKKVKANILLLMGQEEWPCIQYLKQ